MKTAIQARRAAAQTNSRMPTVSDDSVGGVSRRSLRSAFIWPEAAWIPILAFTAVLSARPGTRLVSAYAIEWYAVGIMIVAAVGRQHRWAAITAAVLGAIGGGYEILTHLSNIVSTTNPGWTYVAGGLVVVGLSGSQLSSLATPRLAFDPVVLTALQLGIGLVARWVYFAVSGLGLDPNSYVPNDWASPLRAELPLVALALAAVGFGISRRWRPAFRRLGVVRPKWWHPFLAAMAALFLLGLVPFANHLTYVLMPNTYFAIAAVGQRTAGPGGIGVALVYGTLAGIGEETMFRGALQLRAGVIVAAIAFAMSHIQYGVSPILGLVLLSALTFGVLRNVANTTVAMMAHAGYNLLLFAGLSFQLVLILLALVALFVVIPLVRQLTHHDAARESAPNLRPG